MSLQWLRTFATMQYKNEILEDTEERIIYSTRVPLGIVAAIVPWNWPILLGVGKVGPALMTGNTIIMKPLPYTPYFKLELGELAMSIFPPGVFQVLSGDGDLGPWMTEHPDINMISFTGSIPTGKKVAASCAKTLKRYVLELGGTDAAIVCVTTWTLRRVSPRLPRSLSSTRARSACCASASTFTRRSRTSSATPWSSLPRGISRRAAASSRMW
jgi:acyl-CoA reductase-like NAD-dependent aldehyde dehydrogenase